MCIHFNAHAAIQFSLPTKQCQHFKWPFALDIRSPHKVPAGLSNYIMMSAMTNNILPDGPSIIIVTNSYG